MTPANDIQRFLRDSDKCPECGHLGEHHYKSIRNGIFGVIKTFYGCVKCLEQGKRCRVPFEKEKPKELTIDIYECIETENIPPEISDTPIDESRKDIYG